MKEMDAIVSIFIILIPFALIGASVVVVGLFMLAKYLLGTC